MKKHILFASFLFLFVVVPLHSLPFLNGLPLSHPLDVFTLLLLVFVFYVLDWKKESFLFKHLYICVVLLGALKYMVGLFSPMHGLEARYYGNTVQWEGPAEQSTEFLNSEFTRIDSQIAFYNVGYSLTKKPFQLWFLNDNKRFNWYRPSDPDRNRFKFSIHWKGFIYVPQGGDVEFFILTSDGTRFSIDGHHILGSEPLEETKEFSKKIILSKGFHEVELKYFHPESSYKELVLLWRQYDSKKEIVPSTHLSLFRLSDRQWFLDRLLNHVSVVIFILHFVLIAFVIISFVPTAFWKSLFKGERKRLFWIFIFFVFYMFIHLLFKRAPEPAFNVLKGGDDELTHLTHGRNIIINGILDPGIGAFYFVPGYRYILALLHLLFGEGLFMIVFAQRIVFCVSCIFLYLITQELFQRKIAYISLFLNFFYPWTNRFSRKFFAETFALFFSAASLFLLLMLNKRRRKYFCLFLSGILFGLSIAMRPNFALFPLFLVFYFYLFCERKREFLAYSLTFIIGVSSIVSLIAVRNYMASKEIVILSTSGPMNLWEGNTPPTSVHMENISTNKMYNFLQLSPLTRQVIEFARQEPLLFLKNMGTKILYLLGIRLQEKKIWVPDINGVMLLSLLGMWLMRSFAELHHSQDGLYLKHFLILGYLFIQFSTLVIVKPWIHGHRLQTPLMPFMIIYMSYLLGRIFKFSVYKQT